MSEPSPQDLRGFLDFVRAHHPREIVTIDHEVSPVFEVAAIVTQLEKRLRTPIVEIAKVAGSPFRLVTNVCASLPRIARAQGLDPAELETRLDHAYDHLLAPVPWSGEGPAPIRQNVRRGAQVDLGLLPQCRYTESETHPYMAAATVVARDPASGALNLSYHRLMLIGARRSAIFMARSGHLARIFAAHAERGEPTPIVVWNGLHPLWALGSLASGALELDELEVIGGLLGRPLEVVPGLLDPRLPVAARCEIALEGHICHDQKVLEGPFGEFAGYASGRGERPVVEFEAMSWRDGAIYQDIVAGAAEHLTMTGVTLRVHLERHLRARWPFVLELHLPAPMTLYLKVAKPVGADLGLMLREILTTEAYLKHVVCFDPDVELKSLPATAWAIATRAQLDRDAVVLPGLPATELDPSEHGGVTCKWGLDATAKPDLASFAPRNRVPEEVVARLDLDRLLGKR